MRLSFIFLVLFSLELLGSVYKGQAVYAKKCAKCHAKQSFIQSKVKAYWSDSLKNGGKNLSDIHLKTKKAKKSWNYFKSSKFMQNSKHLKDFLEEYAKDSGKVPACN